MPILTRIPFLYFRQYSYKAMHLIPFVAILIGRGDFLRQVVLNVIRMNLVELLDM